MGVRKTRRRGRGMGRWVGDTKGKLVMATAVKLFSDLAARRLFRRFGVPCFTDADWVAICSQWLACTGESTSSWRQRPCVYDPVVFPSGFS